VTLPLAIAAFTSLACFCLGIFVGRELLSGNWPAAVVTAVGFACGWPLVLAFALAAFAFCFPISVLYVVLVLMPVGVIGAIRGKATP
jgi:hypothetical protein